MTYFTYNFMNERYSYNDIYLYRLSDIFLGGSGWRQCVKEELLNPVSEGITGNRTDVTIDKNTVIIEPLFVENTEEYAITIDRKALLQLIDNWQDIVSKKPQEVTFTRHDNGLITMSGKFKTGKHELK